MKIDKGARDMKVCNAYAHALLWHLLDGMGGAVTMERPPDTSLPAHQYVILWRHDDSGDIELIANNEHVEEVK